MLWASSVSQQIESFLLVHTSLFDNITKNFFLVFLGACVAGGLSRLRESRLRVVESSAAVDSNGGRGVARDCGSGAAVAVDKRESRHGQHEVLLVCHHQRASDWQIDGPLCGKRAIKKQFRKNSVCSRTRKEFNRERG